MRIISSCWYIIKWIKKQNENRKKSGDDKKKKDGKKSGDDSTEMCPGLKSAVPSVAVISVLVACFAITMSSYANVKNIIVHLGVGVACFFVFAATIVLRERKLLSDLKALWKGEI